MGRVIDTISITDDLRQWVPGLDVPFKENGLQVILDFKENIDVSDTAGKRATILRPEGSATTWIIAGSVVHHGVPAIFFEGLLAAEVPRISEITW